MQNTPEQELLETLKQCKETYNLSFDSSHHLAQLIKSLEQDIAEE